MVSSAEPDDQSSVRGNSASNEPNAKPLSDFDKFMGFMRRLVAVPHSETKAALDAEKQAKQKPLQTGCG
jgi:hypothetical protein